MAVEAGRQSDRSAGWLSKWVSALLALGVSALSLPLVLGFFGRYHPALDSFSHFRVYLAIGLVVGGLLLAMFRNWRLNGAVAVMLGAGALVVTPGVIPTDLQPALPLPSGTPHYRIVHMNLRFNNPRPDLFFAMVERENGH